MNLSNVHLIVELKDPFVFVRMKKTNRMILFFVVLMEYRMQIDLVENVLFAVFEEDEYYVVHFLEHVELQINVVK